MALTRTRVCPVCDLAVSLRAGTAYEDGKARELVRLVGWMLLRLVRLVRLVRLMCLVRLRVVPKHEKVATYERSPH